MLYKNNACCHRQNGGCHSTLSSQKFPDTFPLTAAVKEEFGVSCSTPMQCCPTLPPASKKHSAAAAWFIGKWPLQGKNVNNVPDKLTEAMIAWNSPVPLPFLCILQWYLLAVAVTIVICKCGARCPRILQFSSLFYQTKKWIKVVDFSPGVYKPNDAQLEPTEKQTTLAPEMYLTGPAYEDF